MELKTTKQAVDGNGKFEIKGNIPFLVMPGLWQWWAVDGVTGKCSNTVNYTVECPMSIILTDVNGDGKFGLEEVIYLLQIITGVR